jgi:hypothetical protein
MQAATHERASLVVPADAEPMLGAAGVGLTPAGQAVLGGTDLLAYQLPIDQLGFVDQMDQAIAGDLAQESDAPSRNRQAPGRNQMLPPQREPALRSQPATRRCRFGVDGIGRTSSTRAITLEIARRPNTVSRPLPDRLRQRSGSFWSFSTCRARPSASSAASAGAFLLT